MPLALPSPLRPPVNVRLTVLPEHPCPYLPGRVAQDRALLADGMTPDLYKQFMDAGFRRSGRIVYQPICPACRACVPVRVPVETFQPTRSQRRCARRNADLQITCLASPQPSAEKFELYRRYVEARHGRCEAGVAGFEEFLYCSPIETIEFEYRDTAGRLLAVGICDRSETALSSVYFYFDPAERQRGLGTFGILEEIAHARRWGIAHYYLGFWVGDCRSMRYKRDFGPNECLGSDGVWR